VKDVLAWRQRGASGSDHQACHPLATQAASTQRSTAAAGIVRGRWRHRLSSTPSTLSGVDR
jgi:hypothetical protein